MKRLLFLLSLFILCASAKAQTSITGSIVHGHWTITGSPYIVNNSCYIPEGDTLLIDPGVDVQVAGLYYIGISGVLLALGTEAAPISFHAQDTTGWYNDTVAAGGWNGFGRGLYGDTGSILRYCNLSDTKSGYGVNTPVVPMQAVGLVTAWGPLSLEYCNIFHNQSTGIYGSGVIIGFTPWMGEHTRMIGCSIHDNIATYSVCMFSSPDSAYITFNNNEFYNNTANMPISILHSNCDIEGNNLHDNTCLTDGGTLNLNDNCMGIILGNKIHHNTALTEGALQCVSSILDINGNLICNNHSFSASCGIADGGGGMHLTGDGTGGIPYFLVRNNVIVNNRSDFQGSAMCVIDANVEVMNNTIVNNSGDNIFIMNDDTTSVNAKNNIFYNTGEILPALTAYHAYKIGYDNNWARFGCSGEVFADFSFTLTGDTTHNLAGTNAMLAAPTTSDNYTEDATIADFSLMNSSPCINTGDSTGAFPYTVDYAGNPRISGGHIDIGAYEYINTGTASVATQPAAVSSMALFPNPAYQVVNVSLPAGTGVIEITNVTGNLIVRQAVNQRINSINISQLAPGGYIVKWIGENGKQDAQKMTKK